VTNSLESSAGRLWIWNQHGLKVNFGIASAGFEGVVS
jgi:hypothetical protein